MMPEELTEAIREAAKASAEAAALATVAAVRKYLGDEIAKAIETASRDAAKVGAEIGAEASVKAVERERRRFREARSDRRFRNTKLLLRNYRTLRENCANAVYNAATAATGMGEETSVEEIIDALCDLLDEDVKVESVMKSAARTQLIMEHLDRMLGVYRAYCAESPREEERRRWRVIEAIYLLPAPDRPENVAAAEHIDKRTVYKDIDAACVTLSALIFGIDGIRLA